MPSGRIKSKLVAKHADCFNPLNAELNPICYLLALLGAHHFLHVSRIRVKSLTQKKKEKNAFCPHRAVMLRFLCTFAKITISDCHFRHVCPSVRPSAWNNSAPTGRIFMKFDMSIFFPPKICRENQSFIKNLTRIKGFTREPMYIFLSWLANFLR